MTRLERLARDKHSSIQRKSVNYGQKRFITLAAGDKSDKKLRHFYTDFKVEQKSVLSQGLNVKKITAVIY